MEKKIEKAKKFIKRHVLDDKTEFVKYAIKERPSLLDGAICNAFHGNRYITPNEAEYLLNECRSVFTILRDVIKDDNEWVQSVKERNEKKVVALRRLKFDTIPEYKEFLSISENLAHMLKSGYDQTIIKTAHHCYWCRVDNNPVYMDRYIVRLLNELNVL